MKKTMLASLVVFVVWMIGSFLIHGMCLSPDYAQLPGMFRPETEAGGYFGWMLFAHVLMAMAFTWIYSRGVEATPWIGQGLRYGVAIAFMSAVPTYMIYYAVQPMPGALVVKQIVFDGLLIVLLGVVVAFFYRPSARV